MKIMQLCLSPNLGGLELYMYRSARSLAGSDEVIAVVTPEGMLKPRLQGLAVDIIDFVSGFRPLPLVAARRLARLIDQHGVEVMHVHWAKDLPLAALAKYFSRCKPKLVYTRQMVITRPKQDAYHRFLYRQVDTILTITRQLAESMKEFLPEADRHKVIPLYYGVEAPAELLDDASRSTLRKEHGFGPEQFVVGLFGRIKHYKGQHLLIEALSEARAQGHEMAALIVGKTIEPDYLESLKATCRQQALQVTFLDFVDEPQRLMQICDCVLLSTYEETFGLVLAEAMRAGVAVVGSDRGGVPEIIDHEKSGLLFRSGDSHSLAHVLLQLKQDPALRARLGGQGKEKADSVFNVDEHYRKLRQLLVSQVG